MARNWTRRRSASSPPRFSHRCSPGRCFGRPRDCPRSARPAPCSVIRNASSTSPSPSIPTATTTAVREVRSDADVRFVWRHLPLTDVHPQAQIAAEAAEAAAAQGAFWEMHDLLLTRQDRLRIADLLRYADELGLDHARFQGDLKRHMYAARVAQDVESADVSGVSGTPTFFINGQRHYGAYDAKTLTAAIKVARARAVIGQPGTGR